MSTPGRLQRPGAKGKVLLRGRPPAERLKVLTRPHPSGCVLFTGSLDRQGYGRIFVGKSKDIKAYRLAWELFHNRPWPVGLIARHLCLNPTCCNPLHIEPGTHAENLNDERVAGRLQVGERKPQAKLTTAQVLEIHSRLSRGERPYRIAPEYGVSSRLIYGIRDGEKWAHLKPSTTQQESA